MTVIELSIALGALVAGWLAVSALVGREVRSGQRLFLPGLRTRLDHIVERLEKTLLLTVDYIDRHVIRLSWYYSLHSFLQAALRVVVSLYEYLEGWFHQNRLRARALRAERRGVKKKTDTAPTDQHFVNLAEHKEAMALTEREKQKLKNKKLEHG